MPNRNCSVGLAVAADPRFAFRGGRESRFDRPWRHTRRGMLSAPPPDRQGIPGVDGPTALQVIVTPSDIQGNQSSALVLEL